MTVLLTSLAQEDLDYWDQCDQHIAQRIRQLLDRLANGPALARHQQSALQFGSIFLSAVKITSEHRLIFESLGDKLIIHQCRFHY
ncbi:MAG: hypothetical protein RL717_21 [Pseudomonadota bacterium]|jgi:toxin YoeB